MNPKIKHVFVVMFENRSFDHMLGFSKITGRDSRTGNQTKIEGIEDPDIYKEEYPIGSGTFYKPEPGAPYSLNYDPPHEFINTFWQLTGKVGQQYIPNNYLEINNNGFIAAYAQCDEENLGANMKCFTPDQLPVLNSLAKEFVVCDHWFSSIPGPTWPNRFFLHAATSGGLDDSPQKTLIKLADFKEEFKFEKGTIFDKLTENEIPWIIYEGDEFSQCYSLTGMSDYAEGHLRPFSKFKSDLQNKDFAPRYIFIEPSYGYVITDKGSFKCGNSQHPLDDIRRGELLLKEIYESIRNSPLWEHSCLIVTYDEHGGFFDHVAPPKSIPPNDKINNSRLNQNGFTFDRLGIRVPTIIISPLIPKNIIDHTIYDHTSLLRTIEKWLNLEHLTERDKNAESFEYLFSLDVPRETPTLLKGPDTFSNPECSKCKAFVLNLLINWGLRISKELEVSEITGTVSGFLHLAFLKKMSNIESQNKKESEIQKYNSLQNKSDALKYIEKSRKIIASSSNK